MTDSFSPDQPNHPLSRFCMVESQLRACGVRDVRVLEQFRTLARENFIPPLLAGAAYVDEDIQISTGRYLMEPLVMARLMEAAKITRFDRVLDLAPASGFSTIVLAGLSREVTAAEPDDMVHLVLLGNIKAKKLSNVSLKPPSKDLFANLGGPYDVVFVNGAMADVPAELLACLADQGRMVVMAYKDGSDLAEARLYRKLDNKISFQTLFEASVKPFPSMAPKPVFVF